MVAPPDDGPFESTIFRVKESFEYFVQAAGVRSPVFRIEAAELPFVERIEMEFVYPAYTGLAPRMIDQGGDIAVLRGTTVRLRVHSTMPSKAGRIVRDEKEMVPLTVNADGTLSGSFQVKADGLYRIDLASPAGTLVTASPQYTIDVLTDEAPSVVFSKPGRDLRATSLDEIFVEAGGGRRLRRQAARPGLRRERRPRAAGAAHRRPARPRAPKSPRATRSSSRSSACSRATSCPTTPAPPTTTR